MIERTQRKIGLSHERGYALVVIVALFLLEALVGTRGLNFALILTVSAIWIGLLFWKMEIGLLALLVVSFYGYRIIVLNVQGRLVMITHLLGGMLIVFWLVRKLVIARRVELTPSPLNPPMITLVLVSIVLVLASFALWDPNVPTEHRNLGYIIAEIGQLAMLVGIVLVVADTVRDLKWMKIFYVVIILAVLVTFPIGTFWPWLWPRDLYHLWMMVPLAYALLLYSARGAWQKLALLIGVFPVTLFVLIGENRIPHYLATTGAVLAVSYFKSKRLFVLLTLLAIILGVVVGPGLLAAETNIPTRIELVRTSWKMFKDHPWLGIGPAQYRNYVLLYQSTEYRVTPRGVLLPHNQWIEYITQTGLVGLLALGWLIVAWLRTALALRRCAKDGLSQALAVGTIGALTGFAISGAGGHLWFLPSRWLGDFPMLLPMWFLFGLVIARTRDVRSVPAAATE